MRTKILLLLAVLVLVSGCSLSFSKKANDNGGFFVSQDSGDTWIRMNSLIMENSQFGSIGEVDTSKIVLDPSDSRGIYLATINNGLFYTYDLSRGWQYVRDFQQSTITELAVDPNNKCTIYISVYNNIYRSDDCTRSWSKIYVDNQQSTAIFAITVDHFNSDIVYAGTSRGEIMRSDNRGDSWETIHRYTNGSVSRIVMDPNDSRIIFNTTLDGALWRYGYHGDQMENLGENLAAFNVGADLRELILIPDRPGLIFLATSQVLLRSDDYGDSWSKLILIPPDFNNSVRAMSVNPKNTDEMYYITFTTFYRSVDGGKTWTTKQLPTVRSGREIIVNPDHSANLYMGVMKIVE